MVRTKLHLLAELVDLRSSTGNLLPAAQNRVIQRMLSASSYVIDGPVLDLLKRADAMDSIALLVKHNLARLPMNPMVVEFEPDKLFHEFVLLEEGNVDLASWSEVPPDIFCTINCWVGVMHRDTGAAVVHESPIPISVAGGKLVIPDPDYMAKYNIRGVSGGGMRAPDEVEELMTNLAAADISVMGATIAVEIALLMLNTQGIEKELHEYNSLNKSRAKKGKRLIPSYHVVHIGRIYRRDGTSIATGHGGFAMPMHWRQAHTRRQHFGEGNKETKIIFVPACIVNFDPALPAPAVKKDVRV